MFFKKEKIESFERITIRNSGMCGIEDFEAICSESAVEIIHYGVYYRDGEVRDPREKASCDIESFLELLNRCDVLGWHGFHGERPRGLLDGTTFRMEAVVNGGREIYADGTENFPAGYRDLMDEIYRMLQESVRA